MRNTLQTNVDDALVHIPDIPFATVQADEAIVLDVSDANAATIAQAVKALNAEGYTVFQRGERLNCLYVFNGNRPTRGGYTVYYVNP